MRLSKAEREILRKITSAGGKASAAKLTPKQLVARARKAARASAKARKKKAGRK